jgi:hypothetical protein
MPKPLKDYTNEELVAYIYNNEVCEMSRLAAVCSEILRRMNEQSPLLKKGWDENS